MAKRSKVGRKVGSEEVLREGQVWAVPLPRLGYCPIVVTRVPGVAREVDFAFGYVKPEVSEGLPDPARVGTARSWSRAWVGLVPTRPFRKARWTLCGDLPGFCREEWPVPPSRGSFGSARDEESGCEGADSEEMWSVETTADEPTMTLLANEPATREEALGFPKVDVVTAASRFEKSLVHRMKGRTIPFLDMHITINELERDSIDRWARRAEAVRAREGGSLPEWLPAGRRTDRELRAGAWLALPLTGGGFGAAMLIERPAEHFRVFSDAVVMGMRRRWDRWPTFEEVDRLRPEDGGIIDQTSMICVRDGRWRVLGYRENHDTLSWTWPVSWIRDEDRREQGVIYVRVDGTRYIELEIEPRILDLDPRAKHTCVGSKTYRGIELDIARLLDGTLPADAEHYRASDSVVTPERMAAWQTVNRAIYAALVEKLGDAAGDGRRL